MQLSPTLGGKKSEETKQPTKTWKLLEPLQDQWLSEPWQHGGTKDITMDTGLEGTGPELNQGHQV